MVDLLPREIPQDVYTGVADSLRHRMAERAAGRWNGPPGGKGTAEPSAESLDSEAAAAIHSARELAERIVKMGWIDRKLVKQTVMTSVYGVTQVGAREQIASRLRERGAEDVDADGYFRLAHFLALETLDSIGDTFNAARDIMAWLADCATLIAKSGGPVSWTTPLGLPILQPYRALPPRFQVKTMVQKVTLVGESDHLPVSVARQRSAFPPNYVHSIDSTHMLMTANDCARRGIRYQSVHDSFWTHAATVDAMNISLREQFCRLHARPLLEELRDELAARNPGILVPHPPEAGDLDLELIKSSPYFFD
jgi:DNA-directed RNA polymerase